MNFMSPSRSRRATVDFACLRVASLGYSFLIMVVIGFEFRDLFFPVVFKFSPVFLFYFLSGYVALRGKTSHGLACFIAGQSLKQSRSNEAVPISVRRWTHCWRSFYSFVPNLSTRLSLRTWLLLGHSFYPANLHISVAMLVRYTCVSTPSAPHGAKLLRTRWSRFDSVLKE